MARQTIGEFLATQRKLKGYTQSQVAEKLGISNRTLSAWEQGRSYPDVLTLPALAELYGLTVEEIVNGEKASSENGTEVTEQEPCENPQKNLLKNSLAEYRKKLAMIIGLGAIGPLILTVFFIIFNYTLAFLVCAAIVELVVLAILLFKSEKSALSVGGYNRYSLAIKRSTARCVLIIGLMWSACTVWFLAYTSVLVAYDMDEFWYEFVSIPFLPAAVCLIAGALLGERQKADLTQSERTIKIKNRKYTCIFSAVCAGLVLVVSVVTAIVGSIEIIKVYAGDYEEKNKFIARYQSVSFTVTDMYAYGLTTRNLFIDVAAVYNNPSSYSTSYGEAYHVEGELYLASDGLNWHEGSSCTLLYRQSIPDQSSYTFREVTRGTPMLLNGSALIQKYPNGGYEAIAEGKVVVFFELPYILSMDLDEKYSNPYNNGTWPALKSVEQLIEADEQGNYRYVTRAIYSRKTYVNSLCGELCAAAVVICAGGYLVTRKRLDISL